MKYNTRKRHYRRYGGSSSKDSVSSLNARLNKLLAESKKIEKTILTIKAKEIVNKKKHNKRKYTFFHKHFKRKHATHKKRHRSR